MSTINRLSESSSIPGEYSRRVAQPVQTERKANLLGVGVLAVDLAGACTTIERALKDGVRGYVCLTGVHGVMEAHRDPEFRAILARALMVAPDGMPTVWVGHRQGHSQMQRVFGPDLMLDSAAVPLLRGRLTFFTVGNRGSPSDSPTILEHVFLGSTSWAVTRRRSGRFRPEKTHFCRL